MYFPLGFINSCPANLDWCNYYSLIWSSLFISGISEKNYGCGNPVARRLFFPVPPGFSSASFFFCTQISVGCDYHLTTETIASALQRSAHTLVPACTPQYRVLLFLPLCNKMQSTFLNIQSQQLFPKELLLRSVSSFEVCVLLLAHLQKNIAWCYVFLWHPKQGSRWKLSWNQQWNPGAMTSHAGFKLASLALKSSL